MIRNLTPHPIRIYADGDPSRPATYTLAPDGPPVRLATVELGTQNYPELDVLVELVEFGHAHDLPPKVDGTWLVVSLPVALACGGRDDLLVPYLEVRNGEGTVVGCQMLARPV